MSNALTCQTRSKTRAGLTAALFWVLGAALPAVAVAADATIKSVRFWQAPDNTRVVLDLSAPADFQISQLSNPQRLVLDIKGAKLAIKPDELSINSKLISKVRESAPLAAGSTRLVFELSAAVEPKAFALKPYQQYGDRLVLDLRDVALAAAQAAKPAPAEPAATAKDNEQRDVIVAIDAGHGGDDPGALGPKGTQEKDITLAIAKKLADTINARPGMKAVLTRTGDYFVPHRKRTELAREHRADLFISIHADGFKDKSASGSSVWVLSQRGAQSEMGRWLEEKESASELLGGVDSLALSKYDDDVARVLLDLAMYNAVGSSLDVGALVLDEMKSVVPRLHSKRVQQAGFLVLKNPDIPSILVETAFISNPKEEALLKDSKHQQKLASAITDGLHSYFSQRPPEGTRFASLKRNRHVVNSGDTLAALAARYNVSLDALRDKNGLRNDVVQVGQVLHIP